MSAATTSSATSSAKPRGKTRQRLLDQGLSLFAHKGFAGVTVSELEEAVGLKAGSGSFYRHFADKEALLEAIIEQEIERAHARRIAEQDALHDPAQDVREALAAQFRLTLIGLREKADLLNLLSRAADHFPSLIQRLRKDFIKEGNASIARIYAERIKRGELINADPDVLAAVVQSTLFGYIKAEAAFGRPKNAAATEAAMIDTLVKMLLPSGR